MMMMLMMLMMLLMTRKRSLPKSWWDPMGPTPSAHKAGVTGICTDVRC